MPLDLTKPVQTRDGRKVRILCTDAKQNAPIIGLISETPTILGELLATWTTAGDYFKNNPSGYDLINTPTRIKRTVWLNVYRDECGYAHVSKRAADSEGCVSRIACVEVTIDVEEGHGL